jgi:hypothetical protein
MNEQPDKLFHDKLYDYQRPVSSAAWKRIARKRKERNSITRLRAAAAILLLAVAGFLLFPLSTKQSPTVIAEKNDVQENKSTPEGENHSPALQQPLSNERPKQIAPVAPGPEKKDIHRKVDKQKNTPPQTKPSGNQEIIDATESVTLRGESEAEAIDDTAGDFPREVASSAPSDHAERKTVTIVFSAEEVNEKYLNKSAVAEATPPVKETSTFMKLLDKAYDLKCNQDPLGELRQKKNEIFALNFSGERQRNEN